jgi:molybdate transport system substrate-binding protein
MRTSILVALTATILLGADEQRPIVFAAASLGGAVAEVAETYAARTGTRILTSFAATSTLAKQIENGAPADLLLAADPRWMDHLAGKGLIDGATRVEVLGNSLVVVAPAGKGFPFQVAKDFPAERAFAGRLAVGDPAHVPVGRHAQDAFTTLGWWSWMEKRLAPAADARAALRMVESGEVACGVVYATDARSSAKVEVIAAVPAELHHEVRYPFAATTGAGPAARAFLAHLIGPEAIAVYERHGFIVRR